MATVNDNLGLSTGSGFLIQSGLGAAAASSGTLIVTNSVMALSGSGTITTITISGGYPTNPVIVHFYRAVGATCVFGSGGNIQGPIPTITDDTLIIGTWDGSSKWRLSTAAASFGSTVTALGDSITIGVGSTTGTTSYASLMATARGWALTNLGVSGYEMTDIAAVAYGLSPAVTDNYVALLGFNDQRLSIARGSLAYDSFTRSLYATLAWLGIPAARKTLAASTSVAYVGSWTGGAAFGSKYTDTNGDTATATIYGTTVYVGSIEQGGTTGTFTVTIDGISYGTYGGDGIQTTAAGATYGPFIVRIPNLIDTAHTVVVTKTGGNRVYFVWAGGNGAAQADAGPRLYIGNCLRMDTAGYATWGGSDSNVSTFQRYIRTAIRELNDDGLNITPVNASAAYDPATDLGTDKAHPNDTGYTHLGAAFTNASLAIPKENRRNSTAPPYLAAGENPAVAGIVRMPVNTALEWRNSTNTSDAATITGGDALAFHTAATFDAGVIETSGDLECGSQRLQSFIVQIYNNAGTLQARIAADMENFVAANFAQKITGASATLANLPSVNNVTNFTNGLGIDAANTNTLVFNVAEQTSAGNHLAHASVVQNNTGAARPMCDALVYSLNVNGTTRFRLAVRLRSDITGNAWAITTANIPASNYIGIRVVAWIK